MIILFLSQSLQAIGRARRESLWHGAAEKRLIKLKKALLAKCFLVGAGGFGPPKSLTTDLQSAPFGHSGILPQKRETSVELVDGLEPPTC